MPNDAFAYQKGITAPAEDADPVTPNDANDLTAIPRQLVIANGGNLTVTTAKGRKVTLTVPAGALSLRVSRVWSTGTTATGISALY